MSNFEREEKKDDFDLTLQFLHRARSLAKIAEHPWIHELISQPAEISRADISRGWGAISSELVPTVES